MKQHWKLALVAGTGLVLWHGHRASAAGQAQVQYPAENASASLAARKETQFKTVDQFKVYYQFQFSDKLRQSGITFFNHVVDDAAKKLSAGALRSRHGSRGRGC